MMKNHQFHLVDPSPWPFLISISLASTMSFTVMFFNTKNFNLLLLSITLTTWIMMLWWRDVKRESTFQGHHTFSVMLSMKYGMMLFIISEVLFFASFFWSFFHHSLTPNQEIGLLWPPVMIESFNPLHIPLINTIILLSSGISVTWSHSSMCNNNFKQTIQSLLITILLGIYFSILQLYEYLEAPFCMSDSIYGSSFFLSTGFHGIHVLIGTLFLTHTLFRLNFIHFNKMHHLGMELSIWYWHFVDIVWLFLYTSIYWWGN